MEKKILNNPWTYVVLVLVLIGMVYVNKNMTGKVIEPGEYDEFAKYLTEQGVKMYGTEWCSHCKNQKELFGSSFQYINFVDCDRDRQVCLGAGVRGYPTWKINGQNYPGEQSFSKLASLSGYEGDLK